MKAILAMAQNRVIGKNGGLPWPSIKEDFKWFKEFTVGNTIVVGKNTFDTLPLLKNRECLVLSKGDSVLDAYIENQYIVNNNSMTGQLVTIQDIESYSQFRKDYLIVAGGAKTYIKLLPYINEFYVTHVNGNYDGDTFMPEFEHLFTNKETIKEFDLHKVIKYTK
jgi:dihydrofolate reductase